MQPWCLSRCLNTLNRTKTPGSQGIDRCTDGGQKTIKEKRPTLDVVENLPDGHLLHLVGPILPQLEQHVLVPLLLQPLPEQLVSLRPRPLPGRPPPPRGVVLDRHILRRDDAAGRGWKPRLRQQEGRIRLVSSADGVLPGARLRRGRGGRRRTLRYGDCGGGGGKGLFFRRVLGDPGLTSIGTTYGVFLAFSPCKACVRVRINGTKVT